MDIVIVQPRESARERLPAGRRAATVAGRVAGAVQRVATAVLATLTRPLPGHVADGRRQARSGVAFASCAIVLLSVAIPRQVEHHRSAVVVIGLLAGALGALTLVRRLDDVLNRCDGLVPFALVGALVAVSGGSQSIYRPLLVMVLLYAALFSDGGRLAATGLLILGALLAPLALSGLQGGYVAELLVEVPVWALLTVVVHALVQRSRASAQTDGLTGLRTHVTFWTVLHDEHERMRRYGSHYGVLLIDLDHFKRINDTHGHRAGDQVLRVVGELLRERARSTDVVARYGGEEFALLLRETTREQAVRVARELRIAIRQADLPVPVTVSAGVASSRDGFSDTPEAVVAAADQALYQAKEAGRDRVAVWLPETAAFTYLTEVG